MNIILKIAYNDLYNSGTYQKLGEDSQKYFPIKNNGINKYNVRANHNKFIVTLRIMEFLEILNHVKEFLQDKKNNCLLITSKL